MMTGVTSDVQSLIAWLSPSPMPLFPRRACGSVAAILANAYCAERGKRQRPTLSMRRLRESRRVRSSVWAVAGELVGDRRSEMRREHARMVAAGVRVNGDAG